MDHIKVDESKRVVGFKSVVGMALAVMIGSALILPGPAVDITGSSTFAAIIVSGILVLPAALSMSEVATALPVSGGEYVYLAKAFGPLVGTIAGLGLWLTVITKGCFGLVGFVYYLLPLVAVEEWVQKFLGIVILGVITLLNLAGTKKLKVVQKWASLGAFAVLLIVTFIAFANFKTENFTQYPFFKNGGTGFVEAVAFVYIGYAGLKKVAALASEIKNPGKTLPKAILTSLGVMTPFFALACLCMSGTIKTKALKKDYAPFHTLADDLSSGAFSSIIGVLCMIAMASMANVSLVAISRFPYAMARDGLLPPFMGKIWEKTQAPWVSILVASAVMGFCILALPIKRIAKLGSSFMLMCDMMTNTSCLVYRHFSTRSQKWYKPKFLTPLFPWTQYFGIASELTMLVFMGYEGLIAILVTVGLGLGIYLSYGRYHAAFTGILALDKFLGIPPTDPHRLTKEELVNHKHHNIVCCEQELEEEIAVHFCPEKYGVVRGDGVCSTCDGHNHPTLEQAAAAVDGIHVPRTASESLAPAVDHDETSRSRSAEGEEGVAIPQFGSDQPLIA